MDLRNLVAAFNDYLFIFLDLISYTQLGRDYGLKRTSDGQMHISHEGLLL